MKSVLISIQPYWAFLIIARKMGWNIDKEKTIEVRKNFPKDKDWNRNVEIYCSKDKKSFSKIPKEYQPLMAKFLGKVIGDFVCDRIDRYYYTELIGSNSYDEGYVIGKGNTCLSYKEFMDYGKGNDLYGWHISALKIYDKPKELGEFKKCCHGVGLCAKCDKNVYYGGNCDGGIIENAPQSWCYVKELQNGDND